MDPARTYRCGAAARWLPRALGGSVLASAVSVAYGVDPEGAAWGSTVFKALLITLGAALALWLVRHGGELRLRFRPDPDALVLEHGARAARLPYERIAEIDWAAPFGPSRSWLPATLLVDRDRRGWRLPALLAGGDRLVEELLDRCERPDLRAWASARGVVSRMGRPARRVLVGYLAAGAFLLAGALFHLR